TVSNTDANYDRAITVQAAAAAPDPHASIDTPNEGATVTGIVPISGWAIDKGATAAQRTGVDRIQVYLDGALKGPADTGGVRPDVDAIVGSGTGQFTASGFSYQLNLTGVSAGPHTIQVRAHSTVG